MYVERQNKEKVSRQIDVGGGAKQRKNRTSQENSNNNFSTFRCNNSLLQRKVGFEFQTIGGNWNVYKKTNGGYNIPEHGEHIEDFDGIRVETDGSDLEFITPPIDENKENEVSTMETKTKNVLSRFISNTYVDTTTSSIKSFPCYEYKGFYINLNGNEKAHPQATVGVKMESIIDLLKKITHIPIKQGGPVFGHTTFYWENVTADSSEQENGAHRQQKAIKESVAFTENSCYKLSPKLKGLIALTEHLILVNQDAELYNMKRDMYMYNMYNMNAKNKMPVMPRTSLLNLFMKLEPREQLSYKKYLRSKNGLTIMYEIEDNKKYTTADLLSDLREKSNTIFNQKLYHGVGDTRRMNDIANPTDIGNGNIGGIFELRSLPNLIPQDEWGDVVRVVSSLIKNVNNSSHLPSLNHSQRTNQRNTNMHTTNGYNAAFRLFRRG